jgi:hypothetical protein
MAFSLGNYLKRFNLQWLEVIKQGNYQFNQYLMAVIVDGLQYIVYSNDDELKL